MFTNDNNAQFAVITSGSLKRVSFSDYIAPIATEQKKHLATAKGQLTRAKRAGGAAPCETVADRRQTVLRAEIAAHDEKKAAQKANMMAATPRTEVPTRARLRAQMACNEIENEIEDLQARRKDWTQHGRTTGGTFDKKTGKCVGGITVFRQADIDLIDRMIAEKKAELAYFAAQA